TATNGSGKAVQLGAGGSVTNGSDTNTTALISALNTGLDIEGAAGTVINGGTIIGTGAGFGRGIVMSAGGSVVNGSTANTAALISAISANAVFLGTNGSVQNFGTIVDNSTISGSGIRGTGALSVVNGGETNRNALISGYGAGISVGGGNSTIVNFGTVRATGTSTVAGQLSQGIYLAFGGSVTNGSPTDTAAYIGAPAFGVDIEHNAGTVVNFGTIKGTSASANSRGVVLGAGGTLTNGSETSTAAYIYSTNRNGVYVGSNPGTVTNFGLIKSTGRNGVVLINGGTVTNGSTADTTATINAARSPVYTRGATFSVINNFGTLTAGTAGRSGVNLYTGNGSVTNGSATSTTARIIGGNYSFGVYGGGSNVTVANFGTIQAGTGIVTRNGGIITNGSTTDTVAVIRSSTGNSDGISNGNTGALNVSNFGTITGLNGVSVGGTSTAVITNGTSGSTGALISGAAGNITSAAGISIFGSASANVTNFGTISGYNGIFSTVTAGNTTVTNSGSIIATGTAGAAILFGSGNDRLIISPGAVFTGGVFGGAGSNTIELAAAAGPAGNISGIGTNFSAFSTLVVDPAARWNTSGANTIPTIQNKGVITLTNGGTLTASIDPASTGTFMINTTTVLDVTSDTGNANFIRFLGTGTLAIEHASTFGQNVGTPGYTGPTIKNFIAGDKIDLKDVAFGAGLAFTYDAVAGLLNITLGGSGVASMRFETATLGVGTFHAVNDGSGFTLITHF
ncbi:MAG: hypothetical protein NT133_04845, partial [Alphaproteobacteria bacterium]|nr:hypothetical protein [Alphaproteobacteria bacterium]